MPTIRQTICLSLILTVAVSGCSRNRVRDLFGRNNAGFVTLDELDRELNAQSQSPRLAARSSQRTSDAAVSPQTRTVAADTPVAEEVDSPISNLVDRMVQRDTIEPDPFIDFDTAMESAATETQSIVDDTAEQVPMLAMDTFAEEATSVSESTQDAADAFAEFVNEQTDTAMASIEESPTSEKFDELLGSASDAARMPQAEPTSTVNPFASFSDDIPERSLAEPEFERTVPVSFSESKPDLSDTDHLFEEAAKRDQSQVHSGNRDDSFSWDNFVSSSDESTPLALPDVTQHTNLPGHIDSSPEFDALLAVPEPAPAITIPEVIHEEFVPVPESYVADDPSIDTLPTELAMAPVGDFGESLNEWNDLPFADAQLSGIEEITTVAAAEPQQSPVAEKYSYLKNLSGKTWFLMIGGLLVAALLLFPERRRNKNKRS